MKIKARIGEQEATYSKGKELRSDMTEYHIGPDAVP